ncbi:MAG: citrate/2-methylcitrate synthase, partial [Candidatus Binatia bacterium]
MDPVGRRSIGSYIKTGDFSAYWQTRISHAAPGKILVRGYPIEELIEHLTYVESAWLLIRGELPTAREAALLELVLKSAMDQQFINSAVCAARFTASAFPESPIPAIASGMLATGSVTGSPQQCAEMLVAAQQQAREGHGHDAIAQDTVTEWLRTTGRVPGFGHPIHKSGEPRAKILRRLARKAGGWGESGALFDAIGAALEAAKRRTIPMNLAGAIAAVMVDLGWHPLEIGALGAVGYGMALVAHVVEEIRDGVPLRIIPEVLGARYVGARKRHLPDAFRKRAS